LFLSGFRIRLNCGLDGTTQLCDLNTGVNPQYCSALTFSLFVVTGTVMEDSILNSQIPIRWDSCRRCERFSDGNKSEDSWTSNPKSEM